MWLFVSLSKAFNKICWIDCEIFKRFLPNDGHGRVELSPLAVCSRAAFSEFHTLQKDRF